MVLLSGRGEEGARTAEDRVRASGADLTVVRASWFSQNFDEGLFLDPVLGGELALPTGDAVEPFVDVDDVADVAVAALTDDRHIGRTYELSGPRLLGFAEIAAELTEATGREIAYTPVSLDTYRHFLSEMGAQEDFADLFELINDGRNAHLVHGVEEALVGDPGTSPISRPGPHARESGTRPPECSPMPLACGRMSARGARRTAR